MTGDGSAPGGTSLLATLVDALARIAGDDPDLAPFALGWATVELDRAEQAFADTFGPSAGPAVAAPDDSILGASCRIVALDLPGLPLVVLLEPNTEGRLAATLARHGEGPVAAWLGPVAPAHRTSPEDPPSETDGGGPAAIGDSIAAGDPAIRIDGDGPFGPQVLLPGSPVTGPHRFLVPAGPGTITP